MRHSFVPLRKQSKKAQRAYHAGQRGSWNGLSPVTRTVPSGRVYDRNRMMAYSLHTPDHNHYSICQRRLYRPGYLCRKDRGPE